MAYCTAAKKRLTDALIWDKIGEEELTMLEADESSEATLMNHFYELASECTEWYKGASNDFAGDAEAFEAIIKSVGAHKHMIMNYAKAEFHTVKDKLFNIVGAFRDVQRVIESTEGYLGGNALRYMEKRIGSPMWKYQLKYSTKFTKKCAFDAPRVMEFAGKIEESNTLIAKKMTLAGAEFAKKSHADLRAWDCDAMYPAPKKVDLGVPSWLGGVTEAANQGFKIYNVVKNFIPGGSTAGAGTVPGSGSEMELIELAASGVDWGLVKETALGVGSKLKATLEEDILTAEGKKAAWAKRLQIHRQALAMCNADKRAFAAELKETQATIEAMSTPVKFEKITGFPKKLKTELIAYTGSVAEAAAGDMTKGEQATCKQQLMALKTECT